MSSQAQIAANRKNAKKSTGPKTPAGRAAVRLNGVKHGLTAETLVLRGESESDFETLLDSLEAEHLPATPTEEALVRQMAMAQWRLRRVYHLESALLGIRLIDMDEDLEEDYTPSLDPIQALALVTRDDARNAGVLDNLSRYEARLERSFYRALRELQRLRSERIVKMENQTQSPAPARKVSNIHPAAQPPIPPSAVVFAPPSVVPSPSGLSPSSLIGV